MHGGQLRWHGAVVVWSKATGARGREGADHRDPGHGTLRGAAGVGEGAGGTRRMLVELPDHLLNGTAQLGVHIELHST